MLGVVILYLESGPLLQFNFSFAKIISSYVAGVNKQYLRNISLCQNEFIIALCFIFRITVKEAPFELRLHLIYLINDVLHHWCVSGGGGGDGLPKP